MAAMISYQLHIMLEAAVEIQIGKLGRFRFPPGQYIYTGSAKKNLHARVTRHLRSDKRLRWHIDYVLAHPGSRITHVTTSDLTECELNQQTPGEALIPGFGASDCRRKCSSHLKYTHAATQAGAEISG